MAGVNVHIVHKHMTYMFSHSKTTQLPTINKLNKYTYVS